MINKKMPVVFLGHGSPMNAIEENNYTKMLNQLAIDLPKPKGIVMISAHWMTEGTWVTGQNHPKTIHDFYGFPEKLFQVQYPAPGDRDLAEKIKKQMQDFKINIDQEMWGFDHGMWAVLKHMYPKANIPTVQISLNMSGAPNYHYRIGQQLAYLRHEGYLIVGSGNIVHNLRQLSWEDGAVAYTWAIEFDEWVKAQIVDRNFAALQTEFLNSSSGKLSVPTLEHYLPMLYVLGASDSHDQVKFIFEEIQNASISMRCFTLA